MSHTDCFVSVVVPAFNEAGCLQELIPALTDILQTYRDYEIVVVDDGSSDNTLAIIKEWQQREPHLQFISLSRNFGHQNALKAGLDFARGDCVITMDADLQHPPHLLPTLIARWQEGYDIVYTIRQDDESLSFFKRKTSAWFYRLMNRVSDVSLPQGAADFRLLDRAVVEVLKDIHEYYLFYRGLTAWVGFRQCAVSFVPSPRFAGQTKYPLLKMLGFALTGITSFSLKPLRISMFIGTILAVGAFLYALYAIIMKLFTNQTITGWTSMLVSVLFIGGMQLIVLGIIAEYIGKLFMESKRRPHYIIREKSLNETVTGVKRD